MDFYCHKADLVIEVEGDVHDLQQEEDTRWENILGELGLRVVRFRNDDILKNLPTVLEKIREKLLRFILRFKPFTKGGWTRAKVTLPLVDQCFQMESFIVAAL